MTSNNTIHGTEWHSAAGRRRRAARLRRVVGHLLAADRRLEVRAHLRRRAEEPRSVRRHRRHRARGSARPLGRLAADDAELEDAGGERVALQHAAGVRHLHPAAGAEVAARASAACRRSATINERKAKALYDELDRTEFWKPHADADSRSLMNVTFRLPSEELEKLFVKESHRRRVRRPEGPPFGRRPARVDLQRVSRAGRHGSRRRSCRSSSRSTG